MGSGTLLWQYSWISFSQIDILVLLLLDCFARGVEPIQQLRPLSIHDDEVCETTSERLEVGDMEEVIKQCPGVWAGW